MSLDHLLNSSHLADWRQYLDEAPILVEKTRRLIQQAIDEKEAELKAQHQEQYRTRVAHRNQARKDLMGTLGDIEDEAEALAKAVKNGRMTGQEARAELRNLMANHRRMTEVTNEILAGEADLEAFATMSVDDIQKRLPDKYPVLKSHGRPQANSLASTLERLAREERFGTGSADDTDAPSADDIDWSEN